MKRTFRCIALTAIAVLAGCLLAACRGSGGQDIAATPAITGVSASLALPGQAITLTGTGFGATQGTSSLTFNGTALAIQYWSDTRIEAATPSGGGTGFLVVTVGGHQSTGGDQATLEVRTTTPVLETITPQTGTAGSEVTLGGTGFGTSPCAVVFTTPDASPTEAIVSAWSDTSATATVPALSAGDYAVRLEINNWYSDGLDFTCTGTTGDAPVISSVTPANGAPGTAVTITGTGFGAGSAGELNLGELAMGINSWTDTLIEAVVPAEAVSAKITIRSGASPEAHWPEEAGALFIAAASPEVTAFSPGKLVIGAALEIYGHDFGTEPGTVTVGGQVQTAEAWELVEDDIYRITIPELAGFSDEPVTREDGTGETILDDNQLPVEFYTIEVTAADGLAGEALTAPKGTNLAATITSGRSIGRRLGPHGESGTSFTQEMEVTGGSGFYRYGLVPDASQPDVFDTNVIFSPADRMSFVYQSDAAAPDRVDYETLVRIEDMHSGDYTTVRGLTMHVFNHDVPLITESALYDFNQPLDLDAPNVYCYMIIAQEYHGFSFGDWMYFTSSLCNVESDGTTLERYGRNLPEYKIDGANPRLQGYRYFQNDADPTNDGAIICLKGFNFGEEPGEVVLNAGGDNPVTVDGLAVLTGGQETGWSDTEIRFSLPPALCDLSGVIEVHPASDERIATSWEPLICSPYVTYISNSPVNLHSSTLTLTGFDFQPPVVEGRTGTDIYSIWTVYAAYEDPWAGSVQNLPVQLITPIPVEIIDDNTLKIRMAALDIDADGTVPVEVHDASGKSRLVVDGVLSEGNYNFFLWTGVLDDDTPEEIALSGIFSESYAVDVDESVSSRPQARLSADITEGEAPIVITFNGSGSTDDGTITDYEWDFDGDGTFNEEGNEADARGISGPHAITYTESGAFTVRIRVTDNDAEIDTETVDITISDDIPSVMVSVTISAMSDFWSTPVTMVRVYDGDPYAGGTPVDQKQLDHLAVGEDNPATCVFESSSFNGTYYLRLQNTCVIWEDDTEPAENYIIGPFNVPPSQVIDISATQYRGPDIAN